MPSGEQRGHERAPSRNQFTGRARRAAVVFCDSAGWHQRGGKLVVPENISLLPIPPYSPELNPMENVWDYLRGNKLRQMQVVSLVVV